MRLFYFKLCELLLRSCMKRCNFPGVEENLPGTWAIIRNIMDIYLDPETWYVPLTVENEVTLGKAQGNMIKACLLVEGVGLMACKVLPEYKPQYLLRILYPVLERAGSIHTVIELHLCKRI